MSWLGTMDVRQYVRTTRIIYRVFVYCNPGQWYCSLMFFNSFMEQLLKQWSSEEKRGTGTQILASISPNNKHFWSGTKSIASEHYTAGNDNSSNTY